MSNSNSNSNSKKVLISVAPVAATCTHIDPVAIAEDVFECYKAGAAMVHLHVRDEYGCLTPNLSLLQKTVEEIKKRCDIVIEISTGGVSDLTIEERCTPCTPDYVEFNSLNVGSCNLGDAVYKNPIAEVRYCVDQILSHKKKPEVEVFELGMIHTTWELTQQFEFPETLLFALVFGHPGEMPPTRLALDHMVSFLEETFADSPLNILWGYTQAHRTDWDMMTYALQKGASSVRIGFEDSDYLDPDTRVSTNAPLVIRAAELVRETGGEPMTPEEVRNLL